MWKTVAVSNWYKLNRLYSKDTFYKVSAKSGAVWYGLFDGYYVTTVRQGYSSTFKTVRIKNRAGEGRKFILKTLASIEMWVKDSAKTSV